MKQREVIPDEHDLYRAIHPNWYVEKEERVSSAAFRDKHASVDWSIYSTPEESGARFPGRRIAAIQAKIPRQNGLDVLHDPSKGNYSHSLISGKKKLSVSRNLAMVSRLVFIPLS
jgi:hypothetical protein